MENLYFGYEMYSILNSSKIMVLNVSNVSSGKIVL